MPSLRIANFVDSSLEALERKGNLQQALELYNPGMCAEKVIHFTSTPSDARYSDLFRRRNIEIYPFFDRKGNTLQDLGNTPLALLRTIRKMRQERVSVVRGRLPYFGSLIGCLAARVLGLPSIVSLGGDNRIPQEREGRYYFGSRFISYTVEELVLTLCDRIVTPNKFTRRYVASILGDRLAATKTVIIPWILPQEIHSAPREEVDRRLALLPGQPVIAVIGHINQYKFAREMFRLAARLSDRARFVFCGDGPLRSEGERMLAPLGAQFAGWQPNEMVRGLLERADVVLVPMSGFVLLEAASLGRPVVTSNLEWHSELVEHGKSGFLIDPTDEEQGVAAVRNFLEDPVTRTRLGAALARQYRKDFEPSALVEKERQLYFELLSPPGHSNSPT